MEVFAIFHLDLDGLYASVPEGWHENDPQKALGVVLPPVSQYVLNSYRQEIWLQWLMVDRIAVIEYSILLLCAFLLAARDGVVEQLSLDRIVWFRETRGAPFASPNVVGHGVVIFWYPPASEQL